jgi:hypothetical protein
MDPYEYDDNYANQCNPNHEPTGPGHDAGYGGDGSQADLDNHANQMNPNNDAYWSSRGGK